MSENENTTTTQGLNIQQAVLVGRTIAINALLFIGLGVYLVIQSGAWQGVGIALLATGTLVGGFAGASLIQRGQLKTGAWVMLITDLAAPALASVIGSQLGYVGTVYILITSFFIITYATASENRRSATGLALASLAIPILSEVFNPVWRLESDLVVALTPVFTAILGVAFLVVIGRQVWVERRSLRIGPKLWIGSGTLVALTVILAGASFYTSSLKNAALADAQLADDVALKAENISTELLQARRSEKDYLLRYSTLGIDVAYQSYILLNKQYTQNILDLTDEMLTLAPEEPHLLENLPKIRELVQTYETEIDKITTAYQERGFLDTGLEGRFRQDAAALEASPIFTANPELEVLLLQMRRHEKDWLLRQDVVDANTVASFGEELKSQINTLTDITGEQKTELTALVDEYLLSFDQLVEKDLEIAADIETMRTAAQAIEPIASTVIASEQEDADAVHLEYEAIDRTTRTLNIIALVFALIAGVSVSVILARAITGPITRLTETAAEVSAGNLDARALVESDDEVGILAASFNQMTGQLQETLQGLEHRVEERTSSLELAAKVGQTVSQVSDLDSMLTQATQLMLEQFDLYYVQIYLTDPSQSKLMLEAGTGEVGAKLLERHHSLPLSIASINGRAAVEKQPVVISDTLASTTFRKNPMLPDTRGEMALPLIVGERVVGVLDLQTRYPGKLTEELVPAYEALAGQLAVAIQNASLLAEAEQARADLEAQARRQIRQSWDEHLDGIHEPEHFGFVFASNEVSPFNEADTPQPSEALNTLTAPISLTGEGLGSLVVELSDEAQKGKNSELVSIVARQVAQQIENLRLLESAERYRHEAEQSARRQTQEGWRTYMESRTADSLGYLYDLKEVRPYSNGHDDEDALTLPLKAQSETVGKLAIRGLSPDDKESFDLASSVAERLGSHIENLRLFEETRRGQMELDKRARELAAVAAVSTASSQELDVEKMLSMVVHLTQRQFELYHAHVFTFNKVTEELEIVACGWKEGEEHEGTHGTTTISLAQEQSLVARAARTKQPVVVNDVHNEPGWLPNPMLPETKSEMALPLMVGDQVLGVLDVQKDYLNAFTQEDVNIKTTLATQVAIALQNAYSFAQAQKQADREIMLNTINQKIQSATSVEAVLQIAARELGHALGAPMTIAQLSIKDQN